MDLGPEQQTKGRELPPQALHIGTVRHQARHALLVQRRARSGGERRTDVLFQVIGQAQDHPSGHPCVLQVPFQRRAGLALLPGVIVQIDVVNVQRL